MDTGFDDPGIFFSDNFGSEDQSNEDQINRTQVKKRFKDFIRQFHEGNFSYRYRLMFYFFSGVLTKMCYFVLFFVEGNRQENVIVVTYLLGFQGF